MAETLTMMAVHAHPDDEASSTGGVLAAYSAQGIRTVVVTCTNGEFGDAPGGVKPGQNGHDEQAVAQQRLAELRESCTILGVTNLELLHTVGALVVVLDPEGRIIRFNRACEQTAGYSVAEVAGRAIWDVFMVPEEVDRFKSVFQQLCCRPAAQRP